MGSQRNSARASALPVPEIDGPVRTCIGCRGRGARSELLRVVAGSDDAGEPTGALVVDPAVRLPGRGSWLHVSQDCLEKALQRRAFGRALRVTTALDATQVQEYVGAHAPHPGSAAQA